jgi:hypothetical protein
MAVSQLLGHVHFHLLQFTIYRDRKRIYMVAMKNLRTSSIHSIRHDIHNLILKNSKRELIMTTV